MASLQTDTAPAQPRARLIARIAVGAVVLAVLIPLIVMMAGRSSQTSRWNEVRSYAEDLAIRANGTVYQETAPCDGSGGDAEVELHLDASSDAELDQRVSELRHLLTRDGWVADRKQIGGAEAHVLFDSTLPSTHREIYISTPGDKYCLFGIL